MLRSALTLLAPALALASAACTGTTTCTTGESVICACTDGRNGAQVCRADHVFGACTCTGTPSDGGPDMPRDDGSMPIDSGIDAVADAPGDAPDVGPPDAGDGGTDAGCVPGAISVAFTAPSAPAVSVDAALDIAVDVGGCPDAVLLTLDGAPRMLLPPYTLHWDTSAVPERDYYVQVRAFSGTSQVAEDHRLVTVDHTAPAVRSVTPADGTDWWLGLPVSIDVGEALDPTTIDGASPSANLTLTVGGVLVTPASIVSAGPPLQVRMGALPAGVTLPADAVLTIGTGITDLAGHPLAPATFTFHLPKWALAIPFDTFRPDSNVVGGVAGTAIGADGVTMQLGAYSWGFPLQWEVQTFHAPPDVDAITTPARIVYGGSDELWLAYGARAGGAMRTQIVHVQHPSYPPTTWTDYGYVGDGGVVRVAGTTPYAVIGTGVSQWTSGRTWIPYGGTFDFTGAAGGVADFMPYDFFMSGGTDCWVVSPFVPPVRVSAPSPGAVACMDFRASFHGGVPYAVATFDYGTSRRSAFVELVTWTVGAEHGEIVDTYRAPSGARVWLSGGAVEDDAGAHLDGADAATQVLVWHGYPIIDSPAGFLAENAPTARY